MIDLHDVIQKAVSEDVVVSIFPCQDFNDGMTYIITLSDDIGNDLYESERMSYFMAEEFIIDEYRKLYEFLVKL